MEKIAKMNNQETEGLLLLLSRAILSGALPVVVILSLKNISPIGALIWSTFFATIYFAIVVTLRKKWRDVANVSALKDIFWIIAITGVSYQMLLFIGLGGTTAGNASIIVLVEIFFSFLLFHVWKREHIPVAHIAGSLLIILGVLIILSPKFAGFHYGDVFIIMASAIAPVGNLFQRKARKKICSDAILFSRSFFSGMIILMIAAIFHVDYVWKNTGSVLPLLIINGVLMLGVSKSLWIEAIHRVSVTKANAVGSLTPVITLIIAWVFLHNSPTAAQIISLVPILAGFYLLSFKQAKLQTE